MVARSMVTLVAVLALVGGAVSTTAWAQESESTAWSPERLADGQPDVQGMWNNIDALTTPLELPNGFSGPDFSPENLEAIAMARAEEAARPPPGLANRASEPTAPIGSIHSGTRQSVVGHLR